MTKLCVPAAVFLLPVALIAGAAPSAAQQPVRVSSDVVCAECVITIDTVVTLGGLDGEGMEVIAHYSDIAVDARERILVTHTMHRSIYVFDMAGRSPPGPMRRDRVPRRVATPGAGLCSGAS